MDGYGEERGGDRGWIRGCVHFGVFTSFSTPNSGLKDMFPEQKALSTPETCLASLNFAF